MCTGAEAPAVAEAGSAACGASAGAGALGAAEGIGAAEGLGALGAADFVGPMALEATPGIIPGLEGYLAGGAEGLGALGASDLGATMGPMTLGEMSAAPLSGLEGYVTGAAPEMTAAGDFLGGTRGLGDQAITAGTGASPDAISMATNVPVDATATEGTLAKAVPTEPGLGDLFKTGWEKLNAPLWEGGPSTRTGLNALQLGGGLYDMYAKSKMADAQQARINQINNMYAPGTPEYNNMMRTIARKDAAAGRNSQYGVRAQNLAGIIAEKKANLLGSQGYNSMINSQLANRYGGLNSLFALAGKTAAPKVVNPTGA